LDRVCDSHFLQWRPLEKSIAVPDLRNDDTF
jgi:hypothetical protein